MEDVDWGELSERARNALGKCRSVMAVVRLVEPSDGGLSEQAQESTLEVRFGRPDYWRIEREGELMLLRDGTSHLTLAKSGLMKRQPQEAGWVPGTEIGGLGWGHPDLFRDPPAFQEAIAGPVRTAVAGRQAWEVVLAAPGTKPYSLRLAIDHETGLVLRYAAEGTPYIAEVLDIAVNTDLPADTFAWDGETETGRADIDDARSHAEYGDLLGTGR
jgi:hypothetical protein